MGAIRIFQSYAILNQNAFKVRVRYENVENRYEHRYFIECIDMVNWSWITIDSNVIDESVEIHLNDAVDRTKWYLKNRFKYEVFRVDIIPEEKQKLNHKTKQWEKYLNNGED